MLCGLLVLFFCDVITKTRNQQFALYLKKTLASFTLVHFAAKKLVAIALNSIGNATQGLLLFPKEDKKLVTVAIAGIFAGISESVNTALTNTVENSFGLVILKRYFCVLLCHFSFGDNWQQDSNSVIKCSTHNAALLAIYPLEMWIKDNLLKF